MNKHSIIKIAICLSFLMSIPVQALVGKKYRQWAMGEFEVPTEIKNTTKITELQTFLDSKKEFTRMAAVRRLGEIKIPNTVDLLVKSLRQEPIFKGTE